MLRKQIYRKCVFGKKKCISFDRSYTTNAK